MKNKILLIAVIVLIIVFGVILFLKSGANFSGLFSGSSYWAVYMTTGDVYFGKLHYFPKLSLTDVWFLDRTSGDPQNPIKVSEFNKAFWGPDGRLYLNEKNILWKVKMRPDSQVVEYIKNNK
ncbi:hypothetical protein HY227_02745 [Candidatus Wolfebacteria bacterium]|nr:hypothetical protein [Candidatus Wolfebacteria bacterium]